MGANLTNLQTTISNQEPVGEYQSAMANKGKYQDVKGGADKGHFQCEEANDVCSIPLSMWGSKDILMWSPLNNGLFSFKSVYHLEHSRMTKVRGEPSNLNEIEKRMEVNIKDKCARHGEVFHQESH